MKVNCGDICRQMKKLLSDIGHLFLGVCIHDRLHFFKVFTLRDVSFEKFIA